MPVGAIELWCVKRRRSATDHRGRGRRGRAAREGARPAGRGPLRRPQLGAVGRSATDALVIDLGDFRELSYDDESQVVSANPVRPRAAWSSVPFLEERGRFFPGGHCPRRVGGFLLQGGPGWNARGWGWAAEYVVAIDVVTADGELVRASEVGEQPTCSGPRVVPARASAWSPASTSAPCRAPSTSG